jgi:hypothetical protein
MIATDKVLKESSRVEKIRTVHIDTSLQVERCKTLKKAQIVEQALKNFGFKSTSSYAKLEFKRAWLQRLSYLYSASQNIGRLDELIDYIKDKLGAHPKQQRRLNTCLEAIVSFLSTINESLSPAAQLIRLRSHIRSAVLGAYAWWDFSVTHEYKGTGCVRAEEQPRELSGGKLDVAIPWCRQNNIKCIIHQFFERNKEHFLAIKQAIEKGSNVSDELKRTKEIIEEAQRNPKYLCGDHICTKLGDALIAIDGLDMDCFAANNDDEWTMLSEVLHKQLLNPVREAKSRNPTSGASDSER